MPEKDLPLRFPKVESPFNRKNDDDGDYIVFDEVKPGFDWVFEDDGVVAVEKLHGTNCAIEIQETEQGLDITPYTRHGHEPMQEVEPFSPITTHHYITKAFQNSFRRGYFDDLGEGVHYGEVVGPDFHGNPHELDEDLFIPFKWLANKCSYNSWGKYPKTFDAIEEWFNDKLFSLFYSQMHGKSLDETSVSNGTFVEGIIFLHPDGAYNEEDISTVDVVHDDDRGQYTYTPHLAKLRRDMFKGYAEDNWPMTKYGDH